jgi:hypothetical protein
MLPRAWLLAPSLALACQLPDGAKDACETDSHCLSGRLCVSGVCQSRVDPAPPTFTRFMTELYDLEGSSDYPVGLESPRVNRIEIWAIDPGIGGLLNRGWADDALDNMWYRDFVRLMPLRDGTDGTSWGDLRQDVVVRDKDGTVIHVFSQTKPDGWGWQPVGTRAGRFRPTVTHLGRNRLVAFQVDAATGEVWVSRFADERWSEWTPGARGTLASGLDAATLHDPAVSGQAPVPVGAQIVGRDEMGRLVTATYDLGSGSMAPWTPLAAEPSGGGDGQATVVTHLRSYHIFVSAKMGGVWAASGRAGDGGAGDPFVQLGNGAGQGGDLDAVSWPFENRWRVRREPTTGRIQLGLLDSDLRPMPQTSTQMLSRR